MTEIVPLSLDDVRPNLPLLANGECWDLSARYEPGFMGPSYVTVSVSISSAAGFWDQTWWDRLRGIPPSERRKTWCYRTARLDADGVTRELVEETVYLLVGQVYKIRTGQRIIAGFDGQVC